MPCGRPALRPSSAPNTYLHAGVTCSRRTIQLMPTRSLTCSRADAAKQLSVYARLCSLPRNYWLLFVAPSAFTQYALRAVNSRPGLFLMISCSAWNPGCGNCGRKLKT